MADLRGAFLDAIRADPDDDAPRLIFADWLDEQGEDDRAEFIRAQIALSRRGLHWNAAEQTRQRAEELLARHRAEWLPGCEGVEWMVGFRRGFAETVEIAAGKEEAFAASASRLFALAPIGEVTIDAGPGGLATFAAVPQLSQVRCLRVPFLDADGLRDLLDCPHLGGLRTLDLSKGTVGLDGVVLLLRSRLLERLTTLSLAGCRRVQGYDWHGTAWSDDTVANAGVLGVGLLARWNEVAGLRRLDLSWNLLDDGAVRALVGSAHLSGLTELCIAERGRVEHNPAAQTEDEGPSPLTAAAAERLRQRFGAALRLWPEW